MTDKRKKFHEFALTSSLFKGRSDWYFCYLKTERIAHVLITLAERAPESSLGDLRETALTAARLPETVLHFAAEEVTSGEVLADIFALLSALRLLSSAQVLSKENTLLLIDEYEKVAEKLGAPMQLSPFATVEDLAIPDLPEEQSAASLRLPRPISVDPIKERTFIKDIDKGHIRISQEQKDRSETILNLVLRGNGLSIKDISEVVRDCSEKTIQRELAALIGQGLIKKIGERRWSVYVAA